MFGIAPTGFVRGDVHVRDLGEGYQSGVRLRLFAFRFRLLGFALCQRVLALTKPLPQPPRALAGFSERYGVWSAGSPEPGCTNLPAERILELPEGTSRRARQQYEPV